MVGWFRRKSTDTTPEEAPPAVRTVHLTPAAHEQLAAVIGRQPEPAVLRIFVKNPGGLPAQYDMALEAASARRTGDTVIDVDGLTVLVDAESMAAVDGATVDFRNDPLQPGFMVEPPAAPTIAETGLPDELDASDPFVAQVQSVLQHHVNPSIAAHGGRAELVGVKDDLVFVALGGGCQGCSMASVTLKQGIEQILKQAIPRIRAVVDATDHAHGSNPFYSSDKGAESPFHQPAKA
ncbi:MAG TPA: NifU family protein [Chloroflexota bacterium]|nr:NifU family protein [Chloroflexota bacterium]